MKIQIMNIVKFHLAGQYNHSNRVRREPRRKPMENRERCARRASPVFLWGVCRDVIERKTPLIVAGSDFNSIFARMKTFWKDVER